LNINWYKEISDTVTEEVENDFVTRFIRSGHMS